MSSSSLKESKRELIMAAAIQVFSQKGYHNAKMEEIALAAGIGKGTIYEYFGSKLQLLQHIMEQSFHRYDDSLESDINNSLSFEAKIKMLLKGHFRFCQQNKELTRFLFWDTEVCDEELREWAVKKRAEKEGRLQQIIQAGIQSGELRALDPKLITVIISGIFGAIWIPVVLEGWEIDAGQAAEQITAILMHGIKN
jgi:AcrR family transcriptional regulator